MDVFKKSLLPLSIFSFCSFYCRYLMPIQWTRRAEWLLQPGCFHAPDLSESELSLLSLILPFLVTLTSMMGLGLRFVSSAFMGSKAAQKREASLSAIFLNQYAVLFLSVFLLSLSAYLWCFYAFLSRSGLTFHLASKFFSPSLDLGGRACARITAGFFASVFSLSFLDPLNCARLFGVSFNDFSSLFSPLSPNRAPAPSSSVWLLAVFGLGGLGGVGGALFLITTDLLDQCISVPTWTLLSNIQWRILLPFMLGTTAMSLTAFTAICSFLHYRFYVGRKDTPEQWKIQQDAYLSPSDEYHEIMLGSFNLVLAGCLTGCIGYWIFTGGHTALYWALSMDDAWYLPLSLVGFFFYVDINAYYQHRLFHFPFLYRHFHKWHHRYKAPTAWSATAIHPVEFLLFQFQLMWPTFVLPMHVAVYGFILMYVWYFGIMDHSGIYMTSVWPWQNDSKFHDDHHRYFHCQFGQNLDWWDRLHGTMRKPNLQYSESSFMY